MNEHQNQLMHIPYEEIATFFKAHPAIWYTIQQMVEDQKICSGNLRWDTENTPVKLTKEQIEWFKNNCGELGRKAPDEPTETY